MHEPGDLWQGLHLKREEEWAVGYGADVEAESETGGMASGGGFSGAFDHDDDRF